MGFFKNQYTWPTNTYGFEYTTAGLVTFGSDAAPNATLPNGVSYSRLQHPQGAAMTGVPFSCNFQGSAFVIATFSDGVSLCFYGGTLVPDSWNGKVLTGRASLAQIAIDFAAQVNAITGWQATPNVDPNGNALNGSVIMKSPSGITFVLAPNFSSVGGQIGVLNLNDSAAQLAGQPGLAASAAFLLIAGTTGTYTLTAPKNQDGSGTVTLANAIARQSTIGATGHLIASTINANTILNGYFATDDGAGNVFVYAQVAWGASANGFTLTITTTGDVDWTTATTHSALTVGTTPNPAQAIGSATTGGLFWTNVVAQVRGGYNPMTYVWDVDPNGSANGIAFQPSAPGSSTYFLPGSQGSTCYFSKTLGPPVVGVQGNFRLSVTDSNPAGGVTVRHTFPVTLINE